MNGFLIHPLTRAATAELRIPFRWHLQAGYITIPGSSNLDHIAENYDFSSLN